MEMNQTESPLAAVDMGSNTIHLVVARPLLESNDLEILADEVALVRLGADVNTTGAIGPERLAVALETVEGYLRTARRHGAAVTLGIATEGIRAASNGAEVLRRMQEEQALTFSLLTGQQEAALTYWGASSGRPAAERRAVVDLGGGSMEFVVGGGESIEWRVSLPLGSGVVHDRLAPSDPADSAELAQAARVVTDSLDALALPAPVAEVVACGGTATTLAALARRALSLQPEPGTAGTPEDPSALPDLTPALLEDLVGLLQAEPAAVIGERYDVELGRALLLAAGATVLQSVLARLGNDRMRISRRGIREGAILAYARHDEAWLAAAERG